MRFVATLLLMLTWVPFNAPDGTFAIRFPDEAPVKWDRPQSNSTIWTTRNRPNQYMVQEFLATRYRAGNADRVLRNYPNPAAAGMDGRIVESRAVKSGPYSGREVRMEGVSGRGRVPTVAIERAFVTDGHLYVVSVHASGGRAIDRQLADDFLDSFVLLK